MTANTEYAQLTAFHKTALQERVRETLTAIGFKCGQVWVDDNRQVTVRVYNLPKTGGTLTRWFKKQTTLRLDRTETNNTNGECVVVTEL